jgi:elongation factor 1-alpha
MARTVPGISVQGGARQHAQLLLVTGVSQLIVCITKMDSAMARYGQERFDEVVQAVKRMLTQVGWKEAVVETRVPFIPMAAWDGQNVVQQSLQMAWWKGCVVKLSDTDHRTVATLAEALNEVVVQPDRRVHKPFRMPITGIFKIKGVGDVVTGRITQGRVAIGDEVSFRTSSLKGKIASCEMHHRPHRHPSAGDIVGFSLKGLQKCDMPRVGDVLCQGTNMLPPVSNFVATVQVLDVPNSLRLHWTPVCFAHSMRGAVRLKKIIWRSSRDTGGEKLHDPVQELRARDVASVEFEACLHALVVETFDHSPELGRIILADGNEAVAFGKVTATL